MFHRGQTEVQESTILTEPTSSQPSTFFVVISFASFILPHVGHMAWTWSTDSNKSFG